MEPLEYRRVLSAAGGTGFFADSGQHLGRAIFDSSDVEVGDFDGDGDLDAFVANSGWAEGSHNKVWLGDGAGQFTDSGQFLGSASTLDVALGDLDGDGDLDALLGNGGRNGGSGGPDEVWLGDGAGKFADSGQRLGNSYGNCVVLGDFDGDGDLDAMVGNGVYDEPEKPNTVWRNDGQGHFTDSGQRLGSSNTYALALADLDGDGDLDAYAANGEWGAPSTADRVWLGDGQGNFTDSGQALGDFDSRSVALGDLDADGDLDAFVSNRVWLNDGQARFTPQGTSLNTFWICDVGLGDLDGDGDLDAVLAQREDHGIGNLVAINDGQANFTRGGEPGQGLGDGESYGVALGDFNGDGNLDAFMANTRPEATNGVWLGDGQAHFTSNGQDLDSGATRAVVLGDLDGDGDLDAFVGRHGEFNQFGKPNQVYINDGHGNMEVGPQQIGSASTTAVALGDLDGDGDLDAFTANIGANQVWLGDGQGLFNDSGQRLGDLRSSAVGLGDFDGDGDLDAVVINTGYRGRPNEVWLNDGWAHFTDGGQTLGSGDDGALAMADVDGDGDLDLLICTRSGSGPLWLNDGAGRFHPTQRLDDPIRSDTIPVFGDLDGDGDLDLFLAQDYDHDEVWLNDGHGHFSDTGQALGYDRTPTYSAALGDIDGDGDLDALAGNDHRGVTVWFNDGTGQFSETGQVLYGGDWTLALALGDLDGDDDLDAVVGNFFRPDTVWLNRNQLVEVDLAITKTDGQVVAVPGEPLAYTITVANNGPVDVVGAAVNDVFPDQLIDVSWTAAGSPFTNYGGGANLIDLPVGGTITYTVTGTLAQSATGTLTNRATVTVPPGFVDTVPENNAASDTDTLTLPAVGGSGFFGDVPQYFGDPIRGTYGLALGDLDDDGDLDVFGAGGDGNVVWVNTGSARFFQAGEPFGGVSTNSVALGDLDGDGVLDAFVVTFGRGNSVWLGDGRARFTDGGQGLGSPKSRDVALGDFDRDGDLDALIANDSRHENQLWVNDGVGNFALSGQNLEDSRSRAVAVGDLDGDGDLDAFFANHNQPNSVWLNDGSGRFADSGQGLGSFRSQDVALGDVDGDGDLDAVVANDLGAANRLWINDGQGRFADSGQDLGRFGSRAVALADVDGDGDLDVFVAHIGGIDHNQLWLGDGSGRFTDSGQAVGILGGADLAVGDLDGDGDTDAFVAGSSSQPSTVWLGDGQGHYSDSGQAFGPLRSEAVALADFDGDGNLDAFLANNRQQPNKMWLGDGQGGFTDCGQNLGNLSSHGVAVGDLNGDGNPDAFVANIGAGNRVWLGGGQGRFDPSGEELGHWDSYDVALGDLDGDGDLDAFVANFASGNRVWLGDGLGRLIDSGQSLGTTDSYGVALGDLDGDGDLDAFVTNGDTNYDDPRWVPNEVYLNDGAGRFTDSGQSIGLAVSQDVALGDLDGDGDLDAFVVNTFFGMGMPNKVYLNDGNAQFIDSGQELGHLGSYDVALGDLDGDGDLDAFVANDNIPVTMFNKVWLNDGSGVFADSGQFLENRSSYGAALGDLDGDGDLDAVAANWGPNEVWLNRPEVVGRYVFYNNSAFDGYDPAANELDDAAVPPDPEHAGNPRWGKTALLPGHTANFQNYTSYARGINGIMVDVVALPGVPTAGDFEFAVGNDDNPQGWAAGPEPSSIIVRPGAGVDGSDRITLIWPDNAIGKQWLQVTVLATANTGLKEADVFYFGNAVGESGDSTTDARVNAVDVLAVRENQRSFLDPAPIDFTYDFNRDARVNAIDMLIARDNQTHFLNALRLITVPDGKAAPQDARELRQQPGHDAVLRQAAGRPKRQNAPLAKLDWLYEFEPMTARRQDSAQHDPPPETLDKLLATD